MARAGQSKYDPPDSASSVGWTRSSSMRLATVEHPFRLESGARLGPVDVEYETYGTLSEQRDNVVLIAHALSGDAHVAGWDAEAESTGRQWRLRKPGWWDAMVGPGKPVDTECYFVVCANVLGSCYGTTGPASISPHTGDAYGEDFPIVTIGDWVRLQAHLLDRLDIKRLHAVVGGSLGGQQALEWALAFPDRVERCIVLAASSRLSTQGLAFNAVGRYSVMHDPGFKQSSDGAKHGLAAARMLAHITYLSDTAMYEKFGRRLQDKESPDFDFGIEFEVESYLDYQGRTFVERFDDTSYLYISRAMDYYDAAHLWGQGDLVKAVSRLQCNTMVVSFASDWLYPPEQCRDLALAISRSGRPVTYIDVDSRYGHDAFLVETDAVGRLLRGFLRSEWRSGAPLSTGGPDQ